MTFIFDAPSGRIRDTDSARSWALCAHLAPLLRQLLAAPATITAVSTAWTRTVLAVAITRGPAPADLERLGLLVPGVEVWENDDSHYDLEVGLVCRACRHALSWPK